MINDILIFFLFYDHYEPIGTVRMLSGNEINPENVSFSSLR